MAPASVVSGHHQRAAGGVAPKYVTPEHKAHCSTQVREIGFLFITLMYHMVAYNSKVKKQNAL